MWRLTVVWMFNLARQNCFFGWPSLFGFSWFISYLDISDSFLGVDIHVFLCNIDINYAFKSTYFLLWHSNMTPYWATRLLNSTSYAFALEVKAYNCSYTHLWTTSWYHFEIVSHTRCKKMNILMTTVKLFYVILMKDYVLTLWCQVCDFYHIFRLFNTTFCLWYDPHSIVSLPHRALMKSNNPWG